MSVSYLFPPDDRAAYSPDWKGPLTGGFLPSRRDTKSVGDRSEAMVLAALVQHGYLVSIPFGENHRYDLIADDGEKLLRIQIKTGRQRNGVIDFRCSSSHQHRRSGPTATRSYFGQIEFLAVYCPESRKVYLVPESELVATKGHLRVAPTLNRQWRNIRWAAEYELA